MPAQPCQECCAARSVTSASTIEFWTPCASILQGYADPELVDINHLVKWGERQSIAQKGVHAVDARKSQLENASNAAKTNVRAPGLLTDERERPFV